MSQGLKHFLIYLFLVFFGVFIALNYRGANDPISAEKKIFKIFAKSELVSKGALGDLWASQFQKECQCAIEFVEASDSQILLQRLKIEGASLGADLVLGLSTFDLVRAGSEIRWKRLEIEKPEGFSFLKNAFSNEYFVPYSWNTLVLLSSPDIKEDNVLKMNDLLHLRFKKKLGILNPRTHFEGMIFLSWITKIFDVEGVDSFLQSLNGQIFKVYDAVEPQHKDFIDGKIDIFISNLSDTRTQEVLLKQDQKEERAPHWIQLEEPAPIFYQFQGIPEDCQNCELSKKFVQMTLSLEGQKTLSLLGAQMPLTEDVLSADQNKMIEKMNLNTEVDLVSERKMSGWLKVWSQHIQD